MSDHMALRPRPRRIAAKLADYAFIAGSYARSAVERQRPHRLPGRLVVTLTSYPPRFPALALTLRSLLAQRTRPDELALWIAHADLARLPATVLALRRRGLTIRACDDLRSYKKLLPALARDRRAFHVIADDDVFYPSGWLGTLVSGHDASAPAILAARANRMTMGPDDRPGRYTRWQHDVIDADARRTSVDLVPTGVGGVLYPPGSLPADAQDYAAIRRLAPHADDLWFYWMARRAGWGHRKVGPRFRLLTWRGTQEVSLFRDNDRGNDVVTSALFDAFGDPRMMPLAIAAPPPPA